jgi:cell shape-determining protein MreC
MGYLARSFLYSAFYRIFNAFLLVFFIVHVVRAGSIAMPVRETLHTIVGWVDSAGSTTEKTVSSVIESVKKQID